MTSANTGSLSWSHCIPTVGRIDILEAAVACSLAQTRPPKEIIVVSASDNWAGDRDRLLPLFTNSGVHFIFEQAAERSSAVQRNQALALAAGDIILFTDDDSLLFPDFATKMMAAYEIDGGGRIVGLGGTAVPELPPTAERMLRSAGAAPSAQQKATGERQSGASVRLLGRLGPVWRWCKRELMMMSMERMFVPYTAGRPPAARRVHEARAGGLGPDDGYATDFLPGYAMSVRAAVGKAEPFNPHLLAYCPLEDLDATYRYGAHGICVISQKARLNHYEVASSRLTRKLATSLGVSNMALFIATNSNSLRRHQLGFAVYLLRRLLGELLKDAGSKRFDFPQARGVLLAIPSSLGIFRRSGAAANSWYLARQRTLLGLAPRSR